ncbi:hypothetical protein DYY65_10025 [Nitrososphaera sp. AFS]|nr:hypothetical protein [Nitrososphaera sp. AFS]
MTLAIAAIVAAAALTTVAFAAPQQVMAYRHHHHHNDNHKSIKVDQQAVYWRYAEVDINNNTTIWCLVY